MTAADSRVVGPVVEMAPAAADASAHSRGRNRPVPLRCSRGHSRGAAAPFAVTACVVAGLVGTAAPVVAAPDTGRVVVVALATVLKRCDFSTNTYVPADGTGRAVAYIRTPDSDTVLAEVDLATARPNTGYEVVLIQFPRSSAAGCDGSSPGAVSGLLQTDELGAGRIELRDRILDDATGAWVLIQRPDEYSQIPAEFYTSDFVAAF
jgi:hypothetical protein